jgi:perosamine synthetase
MKPISMSSPDMTSKEIRSVLNVMNTKYLSIGPRIQRFEKEIASFIRTKYTVAVRSGTAGLYLAVIAAGVGADDLVITTPFLFISSAN